MPLALTLPLIVLALQAGSGSRSAPQDAPATGIRLGELTWQEAEPRFGPETVVVLPLAPGALQHGRHMKLGVESILADYVTRRILEESSVVVAPELHYTHQPAFEEYPGSVSLSADTARGAVADIARSLARFGPRRFYVLDVSRTTTNTIDEAGRALVADGILLRGTDAAARLDATIRRVQAQTRGVHADEIETSMLLYVEPESVDMRRAVREYGVPRSPLQLTRRQGAAGTYSESGVVGDATFATREKGRELVEALVAGIRADIEDLRRAAPPAPGTRPAPKRVASPRRPADRFGRAPDECLGGDDRQIRALGPAFYKAWMDHDAARIAGFWTAEGDLAHPDGVVEGTARVILQNRMRLFALAEYKESRHLLQFGQIRCITADVAIADARWELSGVTDGSGQTIPPSGGLCTLVLRKTSQGWLIEAYRYSMTPQNAPGPALQRRPGIGGRDQ